MALLGALLLTMGLRLYNNGLLNCGYKGELSHGDLDPVPLTDAPILIDGPHRIDLCGDESVALSIVENLSGKLLWVEQCDGIEIFYAYSPRLGDPETVHGKKVNLMIASSDGRVSAGTPLLYGSY